MDAVVTPHHNDSSSSITIIISSTAVSNITKNTNYSSSLFQIQQCKKHPKSIARFDDNDDDLTRFVDTSSSSLLPFVYVLLLLISVNYVNTNIPLVSVQAFSYPYHRKNYHPFVRHQQQRPSYSYVVKQLTDDRQRRRHDTVRGGSLSMMIDPNDPTMMTMISTATTTTTTASMIIPMIVSPPPIEEQGNIILQLHQLYTSYMYYIQTYNLVTQAITAAFFAGIGDIIAQSIALRQQKQQPSHQNDISDTIIYDDNDDSNNVIQHHVPTYEQYNVIEHIDPMKKYDIRRTCHYIIKGLGGGCMWSIWFHYSDMISFDVTQHLVSMLIPPVVHPTIPYDMIDSSSSSSSNINDDVVATYTSTILTSMIPYNTYISGIISVRTIQHMIQILFCIIFEQLIVSPLFFTIWDIPIPALLGGSPIRQIPAQIKAKLVPLLIANAKIWTPANMITYSLPPDSRVLFASMTDVLWQTILSQITSNEITLQPPPPIPTQPIPIQIQPLIHNEIMDVVSVDANIGTTSSSSSSSSSSSMTTNSRNMEHTNELHHAGGGVPILSSTSTTIIIQPTATSTTTGGYITPTTIYQSTSTNE